MGERAGGVEDVRAHERGGLGTGLARTVGPERGRGAVPADGRHAVPGAGEGVEVRVLAALGLGAEPVREGRGALARRLRRVLEDGLDVVPGEGVEAGIGGACLRGAARAVQDLAGEGVRVVGVSPERGAGRGQGGVGARVRRRDGTVVGGRGVRGLVGGAAGQREGEPEQRDEEAECAGGAGRGGAGGALREHAGRGRRGAAPPGPPGPFGSAAPQGPAGHLSDGRRRRCRPARRPPRGPR